VAVALCVVSGLVVSIVAGVFLIELPTDHLPGIALGSAAILVIERIATLFTLWLIGLVVIARSLAGELPVEISGRGVRYADAATAQAGLADSERAFARIDAELEELRAAMARIEGERYDPAGRPRRYAVEGGG
jgi:hypothetical protein